MSNPQNDEKPRLKRCKKCGKLSPTDFCCNEHFEEYKLEQDQFKKACPQSAEIIEKEQAEKNDYTDDLKDSIFQRGCKYREIKIHAIHRARKAGVSDDKIFRELILGGLTEQKARELMRISANHLGR